MSQEPPAPPTRLPERRGTAPRAPSFINLCGDYRFLRGGYWALVDAQLNGVEPSPTPMKAVTAQNCGAALLVAERNGIPVVRWHVARKPEDVQVPCILLPNAGQTDNSYEANAARLAASQWRSATQNGTRPALCVHKDGPMRSMKLIVGVTTGDYPELAWSLWRVFGIPLATVWFLDTEDGPRFMSLDPLPLHELTERELRLYEEVARRPMLPS